LITGRGLRVEGREQRAESLEQRAKSWKTENHVLMNIGI
jgi:hypothetical protein